MGPGSRLPPSHAIAQSRRVEGHRREVPPLGFHGQDPRRRILQAKKHCREANIRSQINDHIGGVGEVGTLILPPHENLIENRDVSCAETQADGLMRVRNHDREAAREQWLAADADGEQLLSRGNVAQQPRVEINSR